ncbi:hypothetical protein BSP239C_03182 [Brevibacterium sp. 239c]|uniref:hypothetical protein n=1 Tax=Brevibacterium sp. 239c TaxID=1965356 RepID=UPI000C685DC2|nr:hypothetical protein [Brevibacterium sp. 239c]SMY01111.1 hypothetical protein BSP239C_03182 [Brevibacterium sp. 239c]
MSRKLKLNNAGFRALRTDPAVKRDLMKRAQRVAEAAGDGFEAHESPSKNRARATVGARTAKARRKQSKDNVLQRALNAGR